MPRTDTDSRPNARLIVIAMGVLALVILGVWNLLASTNG
jgi:hypothetical protein